MGVLAWKVSTFAALGASVFLAVHPIRSGARVSIAEAHAASPNERGGNVFTQWLALAPSSAPESTTSRLLARLKAARTPTATCEALEALGFAGDGDATRAILDTFEAGRGEVRDCAVHALGKMPGATARSWLEEIATGSDDALRDTAMNALAARDDGESRAIVMSLARSDSASIRRSALIALATSQVKEATPLVIAALGSADTETQGALLEALGESGDQTAVPAVVALARGASSVVRVAAIDALGALGGEQATRVLGELLASGRRDEVGGVAHALARVDDVSARRMLLGALDDPRREVVAAAMQALTGVEAPDVKDAMRQALASGDGAKAGMAAGYFGQYPDPGVIAQLRELASKGGRDSGPQAVSALGTIGGTAARAALLDLAQREGPMQVQAINQLGSGGEDARNVSIALLRGAGGEAAEAAVTVLAQDGSEAARDALIDAARTPGKASGRALSALAQRGDEESMRAVENATAHGSSDLRTAAIAALGESGDPKSAPALLRALKDSDALVQRAAIEALAAIGGPEAQRAIVDSTKSEDRTVRLVAVQSLAQLGSDSGASLATLARGRDSEIAQAAMSGLVTADPVRAAPLLGELIREGEPETRLASVQAARELDPALGRPLLLPALHDADLNVVESAVLSLAQLGGREGEQALAALLTSNERPEARVFAADALKELGGPFALQYRDLIAELAHGNEE